MTLLTEDEAKAKWCPLARAPSEFGNDAFAVAGNRAVRGGEPDTDCHCIASACMAWRTGVWDHQRNLTPENRSPGVGFCGAFGKPS